MFLVVDKKKIVCILLLILAVLLSGIMMRCVRRAEAANGFTLPITNRVIVIDAGHGGVDVGASDNGLSEKDINLEVAKLVREYIEEGGGEVIMSREEDVGTHDPDRESGISQKKSDLTERKKLSDEYGADAFVSVHMNKFPEEKYKGAQVFYSKSSDESKKLADSMQKSVKDTLKDNNERVAKADERDVFILKDTNCPSVIVECGFLSNPEEAKLLKDKKYQEKLAWGIYLGIVDFFLE